MSKDYLELEWGGPDNIKPLNYLFARGWNLTRNWKMIPPENVELTEKEVRAAQFLTRQWKGRRPWR